MDFQPFVLLENFGRTLANGKLQPINQNNFKESSLIFSCVFTNMHNRWKLKDLKVKSGETEEDSVCQSLDELMKLKVLIDSSHDFSKYLKTADGECDVKRGRISQSQESIKDCHVRLTRFPLDLGNNIPDIPSQSPNKKRISNKSSKLHHTNVDGKKMCSSAVPDHQFVHELNKDGSFDYNKTSWDEISVNTEYKIRDAFDAELCNEVGLNTLINAAFFKDFAFLLDKHINYYNNLKTQNSLYERYKMKWKTCSVVIQRSQMIEDLVLNRNMWSHDKDVIVDIPNAVLMGIGNKRLIKSRLRRHSKKGRIPSICRKSIYHFMDNQGHPSHFSDTHKVNPVCHMSNQKLQNIDLEMFPSNIHDKVLDIPIDYFTKILHSIYEDDKSVKATDDHVKFVSIKTEKNITGNVSVDTLSRNDFEESKPPCLHHTPRSTLDETKMQFEPQVQTSNIPSSLQLSEPRESIRNKINNKLNQSNPPQLESSDLCANLIKIDQPVMQNLPENHSESLLNHQIDFDEITIDNSISNPDSLTDKPTVVRYSKKPKRRSKRRGREKSKKSIKDFENVVTKAIIHAVDVSKEEHDQGENTQEYLHLIVLDNNNVSSVKKKESDCNSDVTNPCLPKTSIDAEDNKSAHSNNNFKSHFPKKPQKSKHNILPIKRRYTSKCSVLNRPKKFKVDISRKILDLATHNENIIAQCQNIIQEKMKQSAMARRTLGCSNADSSSGKSSLTHTIKQVKPPSLSSGNFEKKEKRELVAGKPSQKVTDLTKVHLEVRISDSLTVGKLRNIEIISNSYVESGEMKRKRNTLRIATN